MDVADARLSSAEDVEAASTSAIAALDEELFRSGLIGSLPTSASISAQWQNSDRVRIGLETLPKCCAGSHGVGSCPKQTDRQGNDL